ncbi:MAG: EVE domain-containing protein [Planctomycetota bacterium]|jgi:predicted RNA-binding protein with PUA-like domain
MNYWLFKAEPDDYGYDHLARDGRAVWDGIKNNQALMFLRQAEKGDKGLIYHTGKEKKIVGQCEVVRSHYPDPDLDDDKRSVIDLKATGRLLEPVTLKDIKADPFFQEFLLVRNSRLSVMPVLPAMWKRIAAMSGMVKSSGR